MEWCFFEKCPLCQGIKFRKRFDLGSLKVFRCQSCGLQFLNPYVAPKSMVEVYASTEAMQEANPLLGHYYDLIEGSPTERFYRQVLKKLQPFKGGGSLLDIGCGRGHFLSLARESGWKVKGLEPAAEHAQFGRAKLGIEIQVATLEEARFEKESFDAITMWDVIEHVPNPYETLNQVSRWLRKGGILLLATPNHESLIDFLATAILTFSGGLIQRPLTYFFVPEHVLYFTPSTLRQLVRRCRLNPLREIQSGTDIDRYAVGAFVKITARVLLKLASLCRAENRMTLICQKPTA